MKYIITETQYNTIVEGNKRIDAFQELINQKINTIKEQCGFNPETGDYDDNTEDFKICDEVSSIEYIIVKDVETFSAYKVTSITIKVDIMYDFFKYKDYDAVIDELEHSIEKSTGLPIKLEYESHNLKSDFQW
jgi:hypothetical protein